MAKLRHLAIACKDPDAMAEFYKKAFDFELVRTSDGPLAYGHHLSDGTIDLAILRFKTDQIGKGMLTGSGSAVSRSRCTDPRASSSTSPNTPGPAASRCPFPRRQSKRRIKTAVTRFPPPQAGEG